MAIKWLDAKRLQGTNAERLAMTTTPAVSPTYTGDMDSSGWDDSNKGSQWNLDTTSNEVDSLNTTGNNSVAFDTDSIETLSASEWLIRFKIQPSGTNSGDWGVLWYVMSSVENLDASSTATDCAGFSTQRDPSSTNITPNLSMGNDDVLAATEVQTRLQLDSVNITLTSGNTYYVEIKRDGSGVTDTVYSDSDFETVLGTKTNAITGSGLRYFVFASYNQGSGSTSTISDFKWWNDTSTPTTNVYPSLPNGTIFNETDTYKYFMFDGTDTWNQMVSS